MDFEVGTVLIGPDDPLAGNHPPVIAHLEIPPELQLTPENHQIGKDPPLLALLNTEFPLGLKLGFH